MELLLYVVTEILVDWLLVYLIACTCADRLPGCLSSMCHFGFVVDVTKVVFFLKAGEFTQK